MNIRKKLVRLAYEKPELRPHLVPLLKKAAKTVTPEARPFRKTKKAAPVVQRWKRASAEKTLQKKLWKWWLQIANGNIV